LIWRKAEIADVTAHVRIDAQTGEMFLWL
jgi:hypothetical protein